MEQHAERQAEDVDGRRRHDHHGADAVHGHGHDDAGLADLLDLDAEVLGSYLDEVTAWAAEHAPAHARTVVDLGAGTGTGSLALARRFGSADVVAVDRSAAMLERVRIAVTAQGLTDRVRVVQADLDTAWPELADVDVVWAASSVHELADPDPVFRAVHDALAPGGLLVVVELDALPRFLPDDLGQGRPGLELRCHDALAQAGWNAHPDWRPHLQRAGFTVVEQRSFRVEADPVPPGTGRYAHTYLSRIRSALIDQLDADDLGTLDLLLADDSPDSLVHRRDLMARSSRTAWAARRP